VADHERGKADRIMTTNGTYPLSSVTQVMIGSCCLGMYRKLKALLNHEWIFIANVTENISQ